MAVSVNENSTPLMKDKILLSIRTSYKHIYLYPSAFCVCIFLFMLYKIFPSLFFFILHSSPVFAITSLLLAALLAYGDKETNSIDNCSRNKNSQINTTLLSYAERETNSLESCSRDNNSQGNAITSYYEHDETEKSETQHDEKRNPEKERFLRLTSLIERRRARMSIRHELKRNLIDPEEETLVEEDRFSPVNIPKWDPFLDQNDAFSQVPGSAPSILHDRKSPFGDLPGTARFARLNPSRVNEIDLAGKRDSTSSFMSSNTNIKHVSGVDLQVEQKDLDLKNKSTIRGVVRNVNLPDVHGDTSGNRFLGSDISQLEYKEGMLIPREMMKDFVSEEENGTSSYSDTTIMLSEYLNLCSSRILPPRKEPTQPDSFIPVELEEHEIQPIEEKVKNPSDGITDGICSSNAVDLEISKLDVNGEHDEILELKEQMVNITPDHSYNQVSNTRALLPETMKIEKNGEYVEQLELEGDTNSVKKVTSILKQLREEIVKAEPDSDVVLEPDHKTHESVTDEMGMKLLSEPKGVEKRRNEDEENELVACESNVTPDSVLRRLSRLDSVASNLRTLRKQNKHVESSSSSSNDFD